MSDPTVLPPVEVVASPISPSTPDIEVPVRPLAPEVSMAPVKRPQNPIVTGGSLWLRKWSLTIGPKAGGEALDLSEFAFAFSVDEQLWATPPALLQLTIYNVGVQIIEGLKKELSAVSLSAGYDTPSKQYGRLFLGNIVWFKHGRQSATDTFVEIHVFSNDRPVTAAVINTWLPAGHLQGDVVKACVDSMEPYGVTQGQITDLGTNRSPRGRTVHGMTNDVLRDVAKTADATCYIDRDSKLHILREDEVLASNTQSVPVLNSQSGLIGIPSQTMGAGVEARCLLNPAIHPGSMVHINERDIVRSRLVMKDVDDTSGNPLMSTNRALVLSEASFAADGYYVVGSVRHWGENRGNPWYSEIVTKPITPGALPFGPRTTG